MVSSIIILIYRESQADGIRLTLTLFFDNHRVRHFGEAQQNLRGSRDVTWRRTNLSHSGEEDADRVCVLKANAGDLSLSE